MYSRLLGTTLAILLSALLSAAAARAGVSQTAQVAAEAFVRADGFVAVDLAPIVARMPALGQNMTPPEAAALLLEDREARTVWRARTVVRLERRKRGDDVIDLVDIDRYNLGPALRLAMAHDAGKAPPAEAFGIGPHVGWRIATVPSGPFGTTILAAGRRDYLDFEARSRDCAGLVCTSVATGLEQHGDWSPIAASTAPPGPSPYPATVTHSDGQIDVDDETLAHALRELAVLGGLAATGNGLQWLGAADNKPALIMIDNEAGDGEDGIACPDMSATPPHCARRTVIVNPGPSLEIGLFKGSLNRN